MYHLGEYLVCDWDKSIVPHFNMRIMAGHVTLVFLVLLMSIFQLEPSDLIFKNTLWGHMM